MGSDLHMIRLAVRADRLFDMARRMKLPVGELDVGYAVHVHLTTLFGELAPKPFHLDVRGEGVTPRMVPVLGYAGYDHEALREHAQLLADPRSWEACDWTTFASKPMPASWRAGQHLDFRVRACPVVRRARADGEQRKGAEVDVFLARCSSVGSEARVDRADVYREWLEGQMGRHGARVRNASMDRFRFERVVRRSHGNDRKARVFPRPDVTFRGTLEVVDPEGFGELVARGVGRHRAFGYGMLLLTPPVGAGRD